VKSVSRGERGKKVAVGRKEKGRTIGERRGEEKRKKEERAFPFTFTVYDAGFGLYISWNTLPV
jgi:hypothetical protein